MGDEPAFAQRIAVQVLRERGLAPAAHAMPHHHDFADLEELHGEFESRRNPVLAGRGLERRHQCRDIAHDEDLTRVDVENLRRIDATVRARDHHDLWRLPFLQLFPAVVLFLPVPLAKAGVAFDHLFECLHDKSAAPNCAAMQVPARIAMRVAAAGQGA